MKKNDHKNVNAHRVMKQAGYSVKPGKFAKGGAVSHSDESEDKKLIKKMIEKDKKKEHKKEGGFVHGGMPKQRLDKISRQTAKGDSHDTFKENPTNKDKYAKGGKVKSKGKTQINVIVGGHGDAPAAQPMPVMPPRPMPAPPMPPAGGMPPAGPPSAPPGMHPAMKRGGKVIKMDYASGGGKGRLEKAERYGKKPKD